MVEDILSTYVFSNYELSIISDLALSGSSEAITDLARTMSSYYGEAVRIAMILRYNFDTIGSRFYQ